MTLYEIKENYLNALNSLEVNEDGEITNLDVIEQAEGEFRDKAEAVACFIKSLDAEAKALKEEADNLYDRASAKKNRSEKLKEYLSFCMTSADVSKVETSKVNLFFRTSTKVVVDDESVIPEEYIVTKTTQSVSKSAIKEDIMSGKDVAGAHMETSMNLQIK